MSWSPESATNGHNVFDASGSDTNVEDNQAIAGEEHHKDNALQKRLTLTFQNVTVNVAAPGEALGDTLLSWVNPSQLLNPFRKGDRTQRV
jgi:ATP-binding cassette, subfamily G (WHITE), member 2, SNQ2